jgi:hypothetical protein
VGEKRGGRRKGRVMTQSLYAHMNKGNFQKGKKSPTYSRRFPSNNE